VHFAAFPDFRQGINPCSCRERHPAELTGVAILALSQTARAGAGEGVSRG